MKTIVQRLLAITLLTATAAQAHTFVWSVWVNGVDQGSGSAIRHPAFNGPPFATDPAFGPGSGYANSPVRDLNKIEMRCNVLGDVPNNKTLSVKPGDVLTLEWHHDYRTAADDIIDKSHTGAGVVYLSPDPPVGNTWVKIQQEGENPPGTWYAGGKLNALKGKQDVQIPANLAPGYYVLRGELLTLHEADVAHTANMNRGVQIYIPCIQIRVTGRGTVKLPTGVAFPGAYKYTDPGIVYNIYSSTAGQSYTIPGPSVWSGAAPSPSAPSYGTTLGYTSNERWSTWIGSGFSTATAATSITIGAGTATKVYPYTPAWPTTYVHPASALASLAASYASVDRARTVGAQVTAPPALENVVSNGVLQGLRG